MAEQKAHKNNMAAMILVGVVIAVASFYGGMQYQMSQRGNSAGAQLAGRNGSFGDRQAGQGRGFNSQNRPVSGEIISQDDASVTVKMQDGSTKIVIVSDKTTINKASTGTKSDLKTGEKVTVFGTENSDGSVTAQNVSIGGNMLRMMRPSGEPKN